MRDFVEAIATLRWSRSPGRLRARACSREADKSKGTEGMPKVIYVSSAGDAREVEVPAGTTIMAAALKNGIDEIVAECGGVCMCSTCHVFVDEAFFNQLLPASDTEEAVLEIAAEERQPTSRLSCQIKVTDDISGIIVRLPARQR
jgi:2Fe-2S ferredoxin